MALVQAILVFLTVLSGTVSVLRDSFPHVRATQPDVAALVQDAARRSPTFAALLRRLQNSDIVVFVRSTTVLPGRITGRTFLVKATPLIRYVRSEVRADAPEADIIVSIAHELQHVTEIAAATVVRDDRGVQFLFEKIGHRHSTGYETEAAQLVGMRVRSELARRPPDLRAAQPTAPPAPFASTRCAIS